MMDFDTARLRAFLHVAERGTVAAAAEALGYTAPAVSQQIAKLEAQLGTALFDRVGGRLRLNASGTNLIPIARQMLDLMSAAEQVTESNGPRHVVIASFASAITALVIPLLTSSTGRSVELVIREAEDTDALRDLGLGDVDIAIIQEYDGEPMERSNRFRYTTLLSDRLRLVAPPRFAPSVRLRDLVDTGWIINGDATRCTRATERILEGAGIAPRIRGQAGDNRALLALVAAGHGATIAPELVIADAPADITIATADLRVKRTILGVTRRATASEFTDLLRAMTVRRRGLQNGSLGASNGAAEPHESW